MQASKIKIGPLYAVRLDSGDLARFVVDEVVTRRLNSHNNPHDYKSHVVGRVREGDSTEVIKLDVGRILGPYDEHVELVTRANEEKAAKQKADDDHKALVQELWRLLYAKTGIANPNDIDSYKQPFRKQYGSSLEIRDEGIQPLLDYLRNSERR